jgi:hypothetical protein
MPDPNRFDPGSVGAFRVGKRHFDPGTRTVSLRYAFDDGPDFVETITFESVPPSGVAPAGAGFEHALLHLHIAAGTSYYKAAAPDSVVVDGVGLTEAEADFHHRLYDEGLREFAVSNGLPVPRPVSIRSAVRPGGAPPPPSPARTEGLVVPIGGGKDSMVLIEAVRHLAPRLFAVNPHPLVVELAEQTGLELIVVRRTLSPNLEALNRAGALNGHVPITAIFSLVAVVGSFLYGYDAIAMAIERSASEETVMVGGVPVNHQYSKSAECERLLAGVIAASIDPGLTYGSALRPFSELAIARAFARLTPYHSTFCSCNTVFRQGAGTGTWCGKCPKCRFVALMLAPFLEPDVVRSIIGRDLFSDPEEVAGFAALMSEADKPFECVGERRESAAVFRILSTRPEWAGRTVVAELAEQARALVTEAEVAELFTPAEGAFPDPRVALDVHTLLTEPG